MPIKPRKTPAREEQRALRLHGMSAAEPADAESTKLDTGAHNGGSRSKFLGIFGGTSSGLGAFGAAHSVCHYTCQAVIALLAVAGISVAGMPFGFLLDPRLVILFSAIGLVSAGLGAALQWRIRMKFDFKFSAFAALAVVSAFSLASGAFELVAAEGPPVRGGAASFTADSETKSDKQGDVSMEIAFRGVESDTLVFRVAMDSMKMDAPPLARYDLAKLARLTGIEGAEITPARWSVEETGHMGHHVKGTLAFTLNAAQRALLERGPTSFEIVVRGISSERERRFAWKTAPAGK